MLWLEILVISLTVIFLLSLIGVYVYKKANGIPTGECAHCVAHKSDLVKQYHKKYGIK